MSDEKVRCSNCNGHGGDPLSITDDNPESEFYGQPTSPCPVCGGSGRTAPDEFWRDPSPMSPSEVELIEALRGKG